MRALNLMVNGLADIMQKTATFSKCHITAKLRRHNASQM